MKSLKYRPVYKALSFFLILLCGMGIWGSSTFLIDHDVVNVITKDNYFDTKTFAQTVSEKAEQLHQAASAEYWLEHTSKDSFALDQLKKKTGFSDFDQYNQSTNDPEERLYPSNFEQAYNEEVAKKQKLLASDLLIEDGKNSNLKFVIYNKEDGKIISTNTGKTSHTQAIAFLEQLGPEDYARGVADGYAYSYTVDRELVKQDLFSSQQQEFQENLKLKKRMPLAFFGVAACSLLGVFLLGLFLSASGQKEAGGRIRLNAFDRIYTEVCLAFSIFVGAVLWGLDFFCVQTAGNAFWIQFWHGLYLTLGIAFGMFVLSSFSRRLRTHTMMYNTLVMEITRRVTNSHTMKNMGAMWRMILFFSLTGAVGIGLMVYAHVPTKVALILSIVFYTLLSVGCLIGFACYGYQIDLIRHGTREIGDGNLDYQINHRSMIGTANEIAKNVNNITTGLRAAVEERTKSERFKSELITNVSHDIKTPLTSIINYVDLLKKEDIHSETAHQYLDILDHKAQRLKELTENLVEASKASTGNLTVEWAPVNTNELLTQALGEFEEKFASRGLDVIANIPEECLVIWADGRYVWRIIENLFSNAFKYAMENTRIYVDLIPKNKQVLIQVKNISRQRLNITADELMERFVRGDSSRNQEGSGLGLSIARSLSQLQHGDFDIRIDGDLFKATVRFEEYRPKTAPEEGAANL